MAFCKNCGKEIIGTGLFCQICGTKQDVQTNSQPEHTDMRWKPHLNTSAKPQITKKKKTALVVKVIAIITASVVVLGGGTAALIFNKNRLIEKKNLLTDASQKDSSIISKLGNTSGNLANGGWVCEMDGWVFYSLRSGIYKEKLSGGDKQCLRNFSKDTQNESWGGPAYSASDINVVGGWVYYVESYFPGEDGGSDMICKMKADGTEKVTLFGDKSAFTSAYGNAYDINISVYGEWIYYLLVDVSGMYTADYTRTCEIRKMKTNGTQETVLVPKMASECIFNFTLDGDGWIYYSVGIDQEDGAILYKIKNDGSQKTKLGDAHHSFSYLQIAGDWAYFSVTYQDTSIEPEICKIKTDGTGFEVVSESVTGFTVKDECVFFGGSNVHKMSLNGNKKIITFNDRLQGKVMYEGDYYADSLNIAGDRLYYQGGEEGYGNYVRIKTDGTSGECLETYEPIVDDFIDESEYTYPRSAIITDSAGLNIRKSADVNSQKVGSMKKGDMFTITGPAVGSGHWWPIQKGTESGYINDGLDYGGERWFEFQ